MSGNLCNCSWLDVGISIVIINIRVKLHLSSGTLVVLLHLDVSILGVGLTGSNDILICTVGGLINNSGIVNLFGASATATAAANGDDKKDQDNASN